MKNNLRTNLIILFAGIALVIFNSFNGFQQSDCGKDRQNIKTLTDSAAKSVNYNPRRSDINELINLAKPPKISNDLPRSTYEYNTYVINCYIREYRLEADGDYHLVLQDMDDSTKTIIGEIVNPECDLVKKSTHLNEFIVAREEFSKYILKNNQVKSGIFRIYGVCFFDKSHGQLGVAKNGVELHPILSFKKF